MSAPVDVLAMIEAKIGAGEISAAVAELVEAAKELRGVSCVVGQSRPTKIAAANYRMDAALEKFGGAA